MNNLINKKYQILSGSALKTIALITMFIDHIAYILLRHIPSFTEELLIFNNQSYSMYNIFRLIGRIAFPIYCFLISEAYIHTKNKKRYGIGLLIFALLSEIPWNLAHNDSIYYRQQNVFFTLFLGYLSIYLYEEYKDNQLKQVASIILIMILASFLKADYGIRGILVIIFLYLARNYRNIQTIITPGFFTNSIPILFAFIPINMYNGKRGYINNKFLKYLFYALYPIHFLILWYINKLYF